ncbi:SDR family oxidoreductase [Comamonas endophytica]|uniref:SDR family oxidoreductase n=1 Tax=Comamonas endophytica TaxID=2949090 RepID=A0ABY6GG18_9BURK|nr:MULTISPECIES: SDR family oxidoreductase [unclassified Acidovorax]MCD2513376.1 SDR family oxidoreductase [Acidovorax sp. D4N7]UYG53841.1 SDR family oxidoreductase [Acidovorax sp. 5MLIR]
MTQAEPHSAGLVAAHSPLVVVITGASSGIGHATALAFAERGARLVLAARDADTLEPVAEACRSAGAASALVVPTDVTDAEAVGKLAQAAITQHRHIDVWINGVGVGAVGLFDETPLAAHRRVVESNLIGHMNGAHAALRHFRQRGRGTLINLISIGGWVPAPYAAAYTASKFGLRGLSEALRAEVSDLPKVHVCDVAPTFVDSPGLLHGANYTGSNIRPRIPMVDPRRVARCVVALVNRPRALTWVGAAAAPGRLAHAIAPQWVGATMHRTMRWALGRANPAARTDGNLFEASKGTQIDGGQRQANQKAAGTVVALGVLGVAAALWLGRRSPRRLPHGE